MNFPSLRRKGKSSRGFEFWRENYVRTCVRGRTRRGSVPEACSKDKSLFCPSSRSTMALFADGTCSKTVSWHGKQSLECTRRVLLHGWW